MLVGPLDNGGKPSYSQGAPRGAPVHVFDACPCVTIVLYSVVGRALLFLQRVCSGCAFDIGQACKSDWVCGDRLGVPRVALLGQQRWRPESAAGG